MDFVGDEDATRYALELAFEEHMRVTEAAGVPLDALPDAGVARVFMAELARRGWAIKKAELPECVGSMLPKNWTDYVNKRLHSSKAEVTDETEGH